MKELEAHRKGPYKVVVIENIGELMRLQSDWNKIADARMVEPWQSFNWFEAATLAYNQKFPLHIITVRKEGCLRAIAPLVLKPTQQPLNPLQFHLVGGEELKEPNRLIASDDESMEILLRAIASERVYPVRLSRIPEDNDSMERLQNIFREGGWITRGLPMHSPYIDLSEEVIRKSLKSDLRRARKRAEGHGAVRYEMVSGGDWPLVQQHLQTGFKIEASGWKWLNNSAILSNTARKNFFERYAASSLKDGVLRLCFLYIKKEAVAFQYAVESRGKYWLLNIGYNETYRDCSPGNLLLEESVRDAMARGLTHYNLLGKEEPWTKRWTDKIQKHIVFEAYRPNFRGLKSMLSDGIFLMKRRQHNASKHKWGEMRKPA